MYERTIALDGEDIEMTGCVGRISALTGRTANAQKQIRELSRRSDESVAGCCYIIALIYAALGNRDQAFHWLERGYAEHEEGMVGLKAHPLIDSLRDDPRFVSLFERMGFANAANRETFESAPDGRPV